MTKARVPEDKRLRTPRACNLCQKRKQKCDGRKPCNTCQKKGLACEYTSNNSLRAGTHNEVLSPPKRRRLEDIPDSKARFGVIRPTIKGDSTKKRENMSEFERDSRRSTTSGPDEETEVDYQTRLLRDPRGRYLYIGDSAALSYLKSIRTIVAGIDGPSEFTMDPSQNRIMEANLDDLGLYRPSKLIPDRDTAEVLTKGYFVNTQGLVDLLDSHEFYMILDRCYSEPLSITSPQLCLVYLVLANGLVLATPTPGTRDHALVERLRIYQVNYAEVFFRAAVSEVESPSGFGDADFWAVQALSLMTLYCLSVAKRNTAYIHHGTAVRSALALGLHRIGDATIEFQSEQLHVKRNVWRSLFVLDRFLVVSLGRPLAISEEDCSADSLKPPTWSTAQGDPQRDRSLPSSGFDATVKICRVIGRILKKIYAKRKISTKVARQLAGECKQWAKGLPAGLDAGLDAEKLLKDSLLPPHIMMILHVQLIGYHSIVLFTRPFFFHLAIELLKKKRGHEHTVQRSSSQMEDLSKACLLYSTQTVQLIQAAFEYHVLPRRNPFILYCLFMASLTLMFNEFACLYQNGQYIISISNVINIMAHCAAADPQADRLLYIVTTFRDVVERRSRHDDATLLPQTKYMTSMTAEPWASLPTFPGIYTQPRGPGSSILRRRSSANPVSEASQAALNSHVRPGGVMGRLSDAGSSAAVVSPASSSQTPLSHHLLEGNPGNDSNGSDPLTGDFEFDFDNLWNFQPLTGGPGRGPLVDQTVIHTAAPIPQPTQSTINMGPGGFSTFNAGVPQPPPVMVMDHNIPIYPPTSFM